MEISKVKKVTVAGAGTMGTLIAQTFASHGYTVALWNRSESGLARGRSIMAENLDAIPPADRDAVLSGITMTTALISALTNRPPRFGTAVNPVWKEAGPL